MVKYYVHLYDSLQNTNRDCQIAKKKSWIENTKWLSMFAERYVQASLTWNEVWESL